MVQIMYTLEENHPLFEKLNNFQGSTAVEEIKEIVNHSLTISQVII